MTWPEAFAIAAVAAGLAAIVWAVMWAATRETIRSRPRRTVMDQPAPTWTTTPLNSQELEKLIKRYVEDGKLGQSVTRPEDVLRKQPPVV